MTRKILSFIIICLIVIFSSCASNKYDIHIIGNVEETIEVNSNYIDLGVEYPDGFTLIVDGSIDASKLGRQSVKYSVYSSKGELIKEIYRFITVVDSTAPTYAVESNKTYYVGFPYNHNDFIADYGDNYDNKSAIIVSGGNYVFTTPGQQKVEISLRDSSNNSTKCVANVDVVLDIEKLIHEVYKGQSHKITSIDTSIGSHYTSVRIDSVRDFSYFDSGTIHYSEMIQTALGARASIQISSYYGDFDSASVSIHVSGEGMLYSMGSATIDATKETSRVEGFNYTINKLNLDENSMLNELNQNLDRILHNFHSYMNNTLHIELK